ncbi:hypothetical protein FGO68_gene1796 [Halteria grandinella]|uniref:Casein kinase II subunit beta n=1 Tax=Halteria grandinella TaxID=5974 RepID=A0A8J8NKN5_HALGN|nr:hypothetical protein FGO68_gene1796 [Halteria grandinella]
MEKLGKKTFREDFPLPRQHHSFTSEEDEAGLILPAIIPFEKQPKHIHQSESSSDHYPVKGKQRGLENPRQPRDAEDDEYSNVFQSISEGMSSNQNVDFDDQDSEQSWIEWYCSLRGHEFLCEVDPQFIADESNLVRLDKYVTHFKEALQIILNEELDVGSDFEELEKINLDKKLQSKKDAEILYKLIHQRFITSPNGFKAMHSKFIKGDFGYCPRVLCEMQPVLPMGDSGDPEISETRVYCPKCHKQFIPDDVKSQKFDGCAFGPNFPAQFILEYGLQDKIGQAKPAQLYLYGFKVRDISQLRI